jgi:choline dehydrogenase
MGFARTDDFNGARPEGVGYYQINTDKGLRASTANAYLKPALKRKNLALLTKTRVRKVLFEGKRAVGVEIEDSAGVRRLRARMEVILCAGAVQTPQILQLSGVGDPDDLSALGIPVVHAAPDVGAHLQDHLAVSYFYRSATPTLNDTLGPLTGKIQAGLEYLLTRKGPLSLSVNHAGGFVRSRPWLSTPDLQLYFSAVSYSQTPLAKRALINPDPFSAFLLSFNSCRPTSRGRISLASPDPLAAPKIAPNYLSTEEDCADAVRGCRLLRTLARSAPLADIVTGEIAPGPAVEGDEALLADFRERADTVYHPVGTARMGEDAGKSVVSPRLRVHGVEGLRVIDASIFPALTSGNTQAPVIMAAERGAAFALEDYAAG